MSVTRRGFIGGFAGLVAALGLSDSLPTAIKPMTPMVRGPRVPTTPPSPPRKAITSRPRSAARSGHRLWVEGEEVELVDLSLDVYRDEAMFFTDGEGNECPVMGMQHHSLHVYVVATESILHTVMAAISSGGFIAWRLQVANIGAFEGRAKVEKAMHTTPLYAGDTMEFVIHGGDVNSVA